MRNKAIKTFSLNYNKMVVGWCGKEFVGEVSTGRYFHISVAEFWLERF